MLLSFLASAVIPFPMRSLSPYPKSQAQITISIHVGGIKRSLSPSIYGLALYLIHCLEMIVILDLALRSVPCILNANGMLYLLRRAPVGGRRRFYALSPASIYVYAMKRRYLTALMMNLKAFLSVTSVTGSATKITEVIIPQSQL
jgi:hypothetical protein